MRLEVGAAVTAYRFMCSSRRLLDMARSSRESAWVYPPAHHRVREGRKAGRGETTTSDKRHNKYYLPFQTRVES